MRNGREPILSVRDLKTYFFPDEGVVRAVDGASFDVFPGETLGIVGESGCGKSVCARSILRIVERPGRIVGGEIVLHRNAFRAAAAPSAGSDRSTWWPPKPASGNPPGGDAPLDRSPSRLGSDRSPTLPLHQDRSPTLVPTDVDLVKLDGGGKEMRAIRGADIALIFQEPMTSFSPVHTIGNQIVEAIRLHQSVSASEARNRSIDLLHRVGISRPEQRVDEYPYQLSGGLRQRAMIAMALACDPKMLIADEPTTALDVTTQAQILDLLRDLQTQTHMAIMLITHNLGVVAEMCQDVVVMYLGRVVEQGPVDAIFHDPKHPYTQALLRSLPRVDSPARVKLPTISGVLPHPYNRPTGCPFHPRCDSFMSGVCDRYEPSLHEVGPGHQASCFLYHKPERTN